MASYLEYVEPASESPVAFHLWAGLGVVASALQRKTWLRRGHSIIYPNNYIILLGTSGQTRKGEPIQIARTFAEYLDIPMVPEDTSMEKLIRTMRNSGTKFTVADTKEVLEQSPIAGFLEELSVLLGEQNTRFLAYLTNWYDSRGKFSRQTKHQGDDNIEGVCFNLVAATAPDWIPYMFTKEAIGGGFTSRCLFVVEQRKMKIIADPDQFPIDKKLEADLRHDLEHIHLLTGEYIWEPRARRMYNDWYEDTERRIGRGDIPISDPYFAGYLSRRGTHLWKICMALSASRSNSRTITIADWDKALSLLTNLEKKMPRAFTGVGKPRYIQETDMVIEYIKSRGEVTRGQILRDLHRFIDDYTLEAAIKVMYSMEMVTVLKDGKTTFYRFKEAKKKGA